jgi:hypothetical protein
MWALGVAENNIGDDRQTAVSLNLFSSHNHEQTYEPRVANLTLSEMMAREEEWILSQRCTDSSRAQLNSSCAMQYAAKIKRATAISLLSADPGSFKHPPFVLQVLFSSTCTECGSPPFTFEVGSAPCALTVGWQQQVWRPMSCSGSSSTRTHWMSHMTLARMDECPAVTWCR